MYIQNAKKSVKLSRREANYQSLKEWIKKKNVPRKFMFDITALLTLYQTGNIHNMNTVKNDINRLISVQKAETFLSKRNNKLYQHRTRCCQKK